MTLKHTPAPWVYDQKRTNVLAEGQELLVANVRGWGNLQKRSDGAEIMDANGRLIAASPELFALLAEARVTFEMWKDVAPAVSLCADIDKLLQKVKGEE